MVHLTDRPTNATATDHSAQRKKEPKSKGEERRGDHATFMTAFTVSETNLYDKNLLPRSLTAFSGHTRSGLHGNYQISPF